VHKIIEMDFRHEFYLLSEIKCQHCYGELEPFICRLPDEGLTFDVSDVIRHATDPEVIC
jgi:hypothetical protein